MDIQSLLKPETLQGLIPLGMNILKAVVVLVVGLWIAKKVKQLIIKMGMKSPHLDETLFKFFGSIARYVIMIFVFIAVLGFFGVQTTSIVAMLGAASLAVGLALQGTMSNMAAGVMLMVFRPYKVGDFVEVAGIFGNVEEVELFTTILQTFDNQQIIIPNGKIWGEKIVNHSHHPVRGVDMRFNVAYEDDVQKAREIIQGVLNAHPHVKSDPAPFIEVESLSERSVEILVRPFTDGAHYFDVTYSLPEQIAGALGKAGFATPYPQTRIIMSKD